MFNFKLFDNFKMCFGVCFGVVLEWFMVFWWVFFCGLGCFNRPRKDKSYTYVQGTSGNQMGRNYDGHLVKVLNVKR